MGRLNALVGATTVFQPTLNRWQYRHHLPTCELLETAFD